MRQRGHGGTWERHICLTMTSQFRLRWSLTSPGRASAASGAGSGTFGHSGPASCPQARAHTESEGTCYSYTASHTVQLTFTSQHVSVLHMFELKLLKGREHSSFWSNEKTKLQLQVCLKKYSIYTHTHTHTHTYIHTYIHNTNKLYINKGQSQASSKCLRELLGQGRSLGQWWQGHIKWFYDVPNRAFTLTDNNYVLLSDNSSTFCI